MLGWTVLLCQRQLHQLLPLLMHHCAGQLLQLWL
jgi:hypothetical protein